MTIDVGDAVRVMEASSPGHIRTPWFVRGKSGVVCEDLGAFRDPEKLAYNQPAPPLKLLRVRFAMHDVFADYDGPAHDDVIVDLFEHWLQPQEAGHGA